YTEPTSASMADVVQNDVRRLFANARSAITTPTNGKETHKSILRTDCKKIFLNYRDTRLGQLLGDLLSTNKMDVIHSLNLRGISFGNSKEALYSFKNFTLQDFNFDYCIFRNCSFQQAELLNCNFEDAQFEGTINLADMVIDVATTKTFCPALIKAL